MTVTVNGTTGVSLIQDGTVTSAKIVDGAVAPADLSQVLTSGTAQATTSGTSIDFTGIPAWAKRITVVLRAVSTSGASYPQIQIGSGSIDVSGYVSSQGLTQNGASGVVLSSTTGFIFGGNSATQVLRAIATLINVSGNIWVFAGSGSDSTMLLGYTAGGDKTLSGTLDRIRLTTVNGTDTFDAGSVNIMWE